MSTVRFSFKISQHTNEEACINFLNQKFSPSEPNKVWACDFTHIKSSKGFRNLCMIMNLLLIKSLHRGFRIESIRLSYSLFFCDACHLRKLQGSLLFYSDRGSQYHFFKGNQQTMATVYNLSNFPMLIGLLLL